MSFSDDIPTMTPVSRRHRVRGPTANKTAVDLLAIDIESRKQDRQETREILKRKIDVEERYLKESVEATREVAQAIRYLADSRR